MNIQTFLNQNPQYKPLDVLIPEDCALCEKEGSDELVHISIFEGEATVEPFAV